MNHLTDEILNAYVDNELDFNRINEINSHIKVCHECLNRLKAQRGVESKLRNLNTFTVAENFTFLVMKRINESVAHFKPKKSYLFRFIFGFFILAILAILVASFSAITPSESSYDVESMIESITTNASGIFSSYKVLFSKQIVSIVGSILIISIFISIYFLYESNKNFKNRLNKL